jgi:chondroitin AC lyase
LARVLVLLFVAFSVRASSIDVVRANFVNYYTGAGADRTSPAIVDLESRAREYAAPGFLLSSGKWSDIDYADVPSGTWSPWDHTRRLLVMAKAYRINRDPQLRAAIESALAAVPSYYGVTTLPLGNWWFWTLGVPLDLAPTLVLMRGEINQSVYDDCVRTLAWHIGTSPTAKGLVGPVPVAENLVGSAFTHLELALARDDAAMLGAVRDAMANVCMPTAADGIQADASFHQHGPQLYTGGYGAAFANDLSRYQLLTRGTDYALPATALASLSDYIADGIAWSLYQNYFDPSSMSRYAVNSSYSGYDGIAALLQASQFASPREDEIRAAAAQMMQSWGGLPVELTALAANATAAWPAGHRHYFQSDYTVHRRPGWFASVKMFSTRTKSGERTNGENLLGSRQSDGRFYFVQQGDEYLGHDILPAFDWTRLPGTTVEQKADTANDTYGFGTRAFVGGTGDGNDGASAMDYAPLNSTLTAKKSWFFFGDVIVFLTNSIAAKGPVETIVDQRPAPSSLHYWFYGRTPNRANINRTGTWASLGGSTDATPHSATFDTIWFDGTANVEYAISPSPINLPPSILANDSTASAVRSGSSTGIVFWTAGKVAGVQTDMPCVVFITPTDIYVADPTNGSGNIHLMVNGSSISVPRNGGRTYHAKLTPPRRRTVH